MVSHVNKEAYMSFQGITSPVASQSVHSFEALQGSPDATRGALPVRTHETSGKRFEPPGDTLARLTELGNAGVRRQGWLKGDTLAAVVDGPKGQFRFEDMLTRGLGMLGGSLQKITSLLQSVFSTVSRMAASVLTGGLSGFL
jgi:hypothetical protein